MNGNRTGFTACKIKLGKKNIQIPICDYVELHPNDLQFKQRALKRRASPQKKHCQDKWSAYRFTPKLACMYQQFTDGKHAILDSSLFPFGRERKKGHEVYFGLEINEFDNMMS